MNLMPVLIDAVACTPPRAIIDSLATVFGRYVETPVL